MAQEPMKTRYPGVLKTEDGKFRVRIRVTDPRTGKPKEVDRLVECRTAREAASQRDQLARKMLEELAKPRPARTRLRDYAHSWLGGKRKTIAASTIVRYASSLDLHILPVLGDYYLDALQKNDIVEWRDASRVSATSTNSHLRVLRTLMADAVADLDLPRNPCARVPSLPEEPAHTDEDPNLLTAGELARLLDAARIEEPDYFPLFATMAFTGMRPGEATALRWEDVDFDKRQVRVRRAHHRQTIKGTKTGRARSVAMPGELVEVLRELRRDQEANEVPGVDSGWVFPSNKGTLRYVTTLGKPLRRCLAAAGIATELSPHGLRRTLNNLLRQVTTTIVQKSITGHSTDRMAEHYSHVALTEKLDAAERIASLVRPTPAPAREPAGPRPRPNLTLVRGSRDA